MSNFSVDNICKCLSSTKIRERSEALEHLENINFTLKSTLSLFDAPSVFRLISALSSYIDNDKIAFEKSNSNSAVEIRLNKASSVLRLIIVNVVCAKPILMSFKSKQNEILLDILLKNLTFQPHEFNSMHLCYPTALHSAKSLSFLILNQFFKQRVYNRCYENLIKQCLKILKLLVKNRESSTKNENLTVEILIVVYQLLHPKITSNIIVFTSGPNASSNYDNLLQILIDYFKNFFTPNKRERESLVLVFKIMNKLLSDLSTSDLKLCYRIYRLGVSFLLDIKAVTSDRLIVEVSIFINLIASFIALEKVYKITGDNWNVNSSGELLTPNALSSSKSPIGIKELYKPNHCKQSKVISSSTSHSSISLDKSEISIVKSRIAEPSSDGDESLVFLSDEEQTNESKRASPQRKRKYDLESFDENSKEQQISNLGNLIEFLFSLCYDTSIGKKLELGKDSINLNIFPHNRSTWFHLRYISLEIESHSAPWLLRLGLIKLITSYYELKDELGSFADPSYIDPSTKRMKFSQMEDSGSLAQITSYIKEFNNSTELLISLVTDDPFLNSKYSTLALQLLIFFFSSISADGTLKNSKLYMSHILDHQEKILNALLCVFEKQDNNLKYWSFFSLSLFYSILSNIIDKEKNHTKLTNFYYNKILKYGLESLKDPLLSKLSCIVLIQYSKNTKFVDLERSIVQQFEITIDLSEINGPAILCKESLLFWFFSWDICNNFKFKRVKFHTTFNTNETQLYSHKISNWILNKYDQLNTLQKGIDILLFNMLISWSLGASDLKIDSTLLKNDSYNGDLLVFAEQNAEKWELCNYILMNKAVRPLKFQDDTRRTINTPKLNVNHINVFRLNKMLSEHIEQMLQPPMSLQINKWYVFMVIFLDNANFGFESIIKRLKPEINECFKQSRHDNSSFTIFFGFLESIYEIPFEKTLWAEKIAEITPLNLIIETGFQRLSNNTGVKYSNAKNFSITNELDYLESFMPSGKLTEKAFESFPEYETYNHYKFKSFKTFEQYLTSLWSKLCLVEHNLDESLMFSLKLISKIPSELEQMASIYELLKIIEHYEFGDLSPRTLCELSLSITGIFELPLTRTYETAIILGCKFFTLFADKWVNEKNTDFFEDGKQLYHYLKTLHDKAMIQNEESLVAFFKLLVKIVEKCDFTSDCFNKNELLKVIMELFLNFNNWDKYLVIPSIVGLIKNENSDQISLYSQFLQSFKSPQRSVESSALFCHFMTCISASSESLIIAPICNLLEISTFEQINVYLPHAFQKIIAINRIESLSALFWNFKEIFIKCWESFEFPITQFPYALFGFSSLNEFMFRSNREITALSMAYNISNIIPTVSKTINIKESLLIHDSLSLSIALSWSENGCKKSVFDKLDQYLKSKKEKERQFRNQYLLIIFQLLKFCDCSSESELFTLCQSKNLGDQVNTPFSKTSTDLKFLGEYESLINPQSCIAMIDYFTEYYGVANEWPVACLYHLTSKILLLIESSVLRIEKQMYMRKLKLLYALSPSGANNPHLCDLLVENVAPYLQIPDLCNEAADILNYALECNRESLPNIGVKPWILIISNLIKLEGNCPEKLMNTVFELKGNVDLGKYTSMFNFGFVAFGESHEFNFVDLIEFINEAESDTNNAKILIKFLSLLFQFCNGLMALHFEDPSDFENFSAENFIQRLYSIKLKYREEVSDPMIIWIGKCLGKFYECTGKWPENESFEFENHLLQQNNLFDFDKEVKSLDFIFKSLIDEIPHTSLRSQYCIESIIGVIFNKQLTRPNDLKPYLLYEGQFEKFESFIYPMDDYVCSLSISQIETDDVIFYKENIDHVLNGFSTLIKTSKYEEWITKILFAIINEQSSFSSNSVIILLSIYIGQFRSFGVKCFGFLILYFIQNQPNSRSKIIINMIQTFFKEDIENLPKEAISLFVELCLLIRVGAKKQNPKFTNIFRELDIPKIYVASVHIGKNLSALMLLEDFYTIPMNSEAGIHRDIFSNEGERDFLKQVYEGIEENDLVFGLPIVPELNYGLEILKNTDLRWAEMEFNNARFESSLQNEYDMINTIQDISSGMMEMGWSGVSHIIHEYLDDIQHKDSEIYNDKFYEQLWKLNQWDVPVSSSKLTENKCIYNTFKQMKDSPSQCSNICNDAIASLVKLDVHGFSGKFNTKMESLESWMKTLSLCNVLNDILKCQKTDILTNIKKFERNTKWFRDATDKQFEVLLLGRRTLFEIIAQSANTEGSTDFKLGTADSWLVVVNELHRYNALMSSMKQTQKSINSSVYIDKIASSVFNNDSAFVNRVAKFNVSKAFWTQRSDTRFPIETLKKIVKDDDAANKSFYEVSPVKSPNISTEYIMSLLALWSNSCKQETPSKIMELYIQPNIERLKNVNHEKYEDLGITYRIMAKFCDSQIAKKEETSMQRLNDSMKTIASDLRSLKLLMKSETDKSKLRLINKDIIRLKSLHESTNKELTAAKAERDNYIAKAISFYLKSIAFDSDDMMEGDVDRFCSLWIEYSDIRIDEFELLNLSTYKFVPWNNQLTSRLLDNKSNFQKSLRKLIFSVAINHPFHTVYLLKSLIMNKEESEDGDVISRGSISEKIWRDLNNNWQKFNVEGIDSILNSVSSFAEKSVKIAKVRLKHSKVVSIKKFPDGLWWLDTLPDISLPSPVKSIRIEKFKPYQRESLPVILKVSESVASATSGISQPKIMKMTLSTGEVQRMLLKAPDDLRQDAIMKQVFEKVNKLLWKDIETRKRNLRIRTYNVLPLGPTSGVLEFVPNSMPLIDILKKLHENDEMDINEARHKMKSVQDQSKSVRIQVYKEICKKIQPTLRLFFFNNFTSPNSWFESRKLYTHGIATTSMIGHILGIGDRHCNNILLDRYSGEPIHIDFGVVFDQGKILPVPETIPFRLTRDIIDGMGVTKTNGIFNKSSEHVLRVLRDNTQYICGILYVLKYDPLYSWTLSPLRKKKLQTIYGGKDDKEDDQKDYNLKLNEFIKSDFISEANTAVESVKKKLKSKGLSNETVVRELIRQSVDVENLALIFMGWSPFL